VCQGPPRWWVKLADFGLSKHRTEETAYRTQTGTQAYMAPEILNYVPGVNPKSSEYTNAVDIWALGCMVYRLVNGVVPFPPGPSLLNFCGDESKFPSQGSALSELGAKFVRDLVVPYPSRRITAQQALDHAWTKARPDGSEVENRPVPSDFKGSEPSTAHPITQINRNGLDSVASFGGYNTVTHAGLQSYGPAASTQRPSPVHAESRRPKPSYHPPTLEGEEDEATRGHGLEANIALDQRQRQSSSDPAPPVKVDTHGVPDEVEEPEVTIKRSPRKSNSFRPAGLEITIVKGNLEPISPELSDSSSDFSWSEIHSNGSNSPRPQSRQAPKPTRYNIDNGRSVPVHSRHRAEFRDSNEASHTRNRRASPPILPTRGFHIRGQYSKPFSYVDDCSGPATPLTLDNLNKLVSKSEASDSADGSADARCASDPCASDPCASEAEAIPESNTINVRLPPRLNSDLVAKAASSGRRVYFADEKGHVDYVPENLADRHGDVLEAPEPPPPTSKGKNKSVFSRSSPKFDHPKMTMEDKDAKRVLEWQEDVARNRERPFFGNVKYSTTYSYYTLEEDPEPEPIIRTARPKIPPRDKASSYRDTDINGQPLFRDAQYAYNHSAAPRAFYRSTPGRYRGDTDLNNQQVPGPLYGPDEEPEPIIDSARPKIPSREGGSSHKPAISRYQPVYGEVKYAPQYSAEDVTYSQAPEPDGYRRDGDPNHHRGYYPRSGRSEKNRTVYA
jgi:serine/threonine protein kinase